MSDFASPAAVHPEESRRSALVRLVVSLAGVTATLVLGRWTPVGISLCAFKNITGLPCPGCGMTRSMAHIGHGDVLGSLRMHPLGIVIAGAILMTLIGAVSGLARDRDPVWRWMCDRAPRIAMAFMVLLLAIWVLRAFLLPQWSPDPIV